MCESSWLLKTKKELFIINELLLKKKVFVKNQLNSLFDFTKNEKSNKGGSIEKTLPFFEQNKLSQ